MLGISDAIELTQKLGELVKATATIGLKETIMELREAVLNVKDELLKLREENQSLKETLLARDEWKSRSEAYVLTLMPGGATVYRSEGPPEHFACPRCFESRQIQILQDRRNRAGSYQCPGCNYSFLVQSGD